MEISFGIGRPIQRAALNFINGSRINAAFYPPAILVFCRRAVALACAPPTHHVVGTLRYNATYYAYIMSLCVSYSSFITLVKKKSSSR